MDSSMYIATDSVGITILLLIYFNFGAKRIKSHTIDSKLFDCMLIVNMLLFVMDIFVRGLNGQSAFGARQLFFLTMTVYYLLHWTLCLVWFLYCQYKLTENIDTVLRKFFVYMAPSAMILILAVVNFKTSLLFWIDDKNIYHRGALYPLFFILCFVYLALAFIATFKEIKKNPVAAEKNNLKCLLVYPIFPIIGAAIQYLCPGVPIVWMGSLISLLILYFNLQDIQITTDSLTGINNRHYFETYLKQKLISGRRQGVLFLLMIDLNDFKKINDRHGHAVGDDALKNYAKILVSSIQKSDFAARIGGDEFAVIGERNDRESVSQAIDHIKGAAMEFNSRYDLPYILEASIGYGILKKDETKTASTLMMDADKSMYEEKRSRSQLNEESARKNEITSL